MKVGSIFHCWATSPAGVVTRLEVTAASANDARQMVFAARPGALAVSCRSAQINVGERRDAR